MDHDVFGSLGQIRVLLVPVGSIPRAAFDSYAAEIRSFDEIRLGDIPEDNKDERARFMPKPLADGYMHLCFPSHPPPHSHAPLSLIRPSHFPLAVIGIALRSDKDPLVSIHAQFNDLLSSLFPAESLYPFAKQCFAFEDADASTDLNPGSKLPGLTIIPSLMGNRKLYVGTLLADICSQILGEMSTLVQVLESPLGNEYLNASLLPTLPSLSEIPGTVDRQSRRESLPPIPSISSQPNVNRVSSPFNTAPLAQRTMSSGPAYRQSTLGVPAPASKKRTSTIGVSSSPGRLYKVLGDFFMLAGRTEDAVIWYNEALITFKNPPDPVWQAAALEGLATIAVLDAWAVGHGLNNSLSQTRGPWNDLADKLAQASTLYYTRSPTHEPEHYPMLSYIYCCCVLRHANLLFAIWSAKGWGPLAFTHMLHPGLTPYLPPTLSQIGPNSYIDLERLSLISGVSRSSISTVIAQLHGPWLLHLGARERISILESAASLYSCLGYRRKEAYLLREVLGCVMDLIVCGRVEDGPSSRPSSIIEAPNSQSVDGISQGAVGIRRNESKEGNESVLAVLRHVCRSLGIDLEAVRLLETSEESKVSVDADGTIAVDDDIDNSLSQSVGWPELQVGVVREAVAIAEALPDFVAVAQFALSALKTLRLHLVPADQHHLHRLAVTALATAQRRGDPKYVDYWTGNPIMSISMTPLPIARIPLEKPISALGIQQPESTAIIAGVTDPFLYNPRRAATNQRMSVVQGEALEFEVSLKNPYVFDLDLQSLSLLTSGAAFESDPSSATIPANSYHTVKLTGTPTEPGPLIIKGCVVRAPGGASKEFIIPLATPEEEERQFKKRNALLYELDRAKYPGLGMDGQRPEEKDGAKRDSHQAAPAPAKPLRFMEYNVVPEQPLIRIRRTSLTHSALMLYDGETSTVRLTLENVSKLPVDFIHLAFDDSTIAPAQQALAEGELSVFETYETEYDLIHRPLFSWHNDEKTIKFLPGQKMNVNVAAFGKIGCTSGTIHITYSYVHRDENPEKPLKVFHTRQLSFPVSVTVYHMLECHGLDILPLSSFAPISGGAPLAEESEWSEWCLFSVEIRNAYGSPFEVAFESFQEGTPHRTVSTAVAPGATSRIVLPIKKLLLSDDVVSQVIPTLSDRQFVVTKTGLTASEESLMRELFWYREEIFKCVEGHWKEIAGTRSGNLSLRQQRLSLSMLQVLRRNSTQVQLKLLDLDEDEVPHQGGKYLPSRNEFVTLRLRAKNTSPSSLVTYVEWKIEPLEQVIFEGVLSRQAVGRIDPGEAKEVDVPLCFLALGTYSISAEVRMLEAMNETSFAGTGHLSAVIRES